MVYKEGLGTMEEAFTESFCFMSFFFLECDVEEKRKLSIAYLAVNECAVHANHGVPRLISTRLARSQLWPNRRSETSRPKKPSGPGKRIYLTIQTSSKPPHPDPQNPSPVSLLTTLSSDLRLIKPPPHPRQPLLQRPPFNPRKHSTNLPERLLPLQNRQ